MSDPHTASATTCGQCGWRMVKPHNGRLVWLSDDGSETPYSVSLVQPVAVLHCPRCGWANVWASSTAAQGQLSPARRTAHLFNRNWRGTSIT